MVTFKKIVILILLLFITGYSQNRIFSEISEDGDNEGTHTYKYYVGYNRSINDNLRLGVMLGNRYYIDPLSNNSYKDIRLNSQYMILNNLEVTVNFSFLYNDFWKPIFYDGLITYMPIELLYFEGYIEKESVGTAKTNDEKYTSTSIGLSTDINLTDDITLVAGFTSNKIYDNTRFYQVYRAIYSISELSVFLDFKAKIMTHGKYSPYYFSPNTLNEYNVGMGIGTELGSPQYYAKLYIGGGTQEVNTDFKGLFICNLRLSAYFTPNLSGILVLGTTNAQSNTYGSYLYQYAKLQLIYSF